MNNVQIFGGYYTITEGKPVIYLIGYSNKKEIIEIKDFRPYFYRLSINGKYKTINNRRVERVEIDGEPRLVREIRDKIGYNSVYEADIPFIRRYRIDTAYIWQTEKEVYPSVAYIDVETNYPVNNDIISIAINKNGELYFIKEDDPLITVAEALKLISDCVLLVGWNISFDKKRLEPYMKKLNEVKRYIQLGYSKEKICFDLRIILPSQYDAIKDILPLIDTNIKNYIFVDALQAIREIVRKESKSWRLEYIANMYDIVYEKPKQHARELSEEELIYMNCMDVIIPEILNDIIGYLDYLIIMSHILQSNIEDVMDISTINDIIILKEYRKYNIVLPNRGQGNKKGYRAAQPDAIQGVYENIHVFDIKHAYPSIVKMLNASFETFRGRLKSDIKAPNGIYFSKEESIFVNAMNKLLEERQKIKELLEKCNDENEKRRLNIMQYAIKTQLAAYSHGIFGYAYSRLFNEDIADAITSVARDIIKILKKYVESKGIKWCYSHTDSIYLVGDINPENLLNDFQKLIENYCLENHYSYIPQIEYKGCYKKGYIHSKARNVLVDDNGEWKVTGMDFMRAETPEAIAELEVKIIDALMNRKGKDEIKDIIVDFLKHIKEYSSVELGIKKPLTKPINEYKGNVYHIRAVKNANKLYHFNVDVGDSYLILPVKEIKDWIAFPITDGLWEGLTIDYDEYLSSTLWSKLATILNMKKKDVKMWIECKGLEVM